MQLLNLSDIKQLVNSALTTYVDERIHNAEVVGDSYVTLWHAIKKLILSGGKRLRPTLLISAYLAYAPKGQVNDVMPAAIAQELLHAAMLIHDDIIDRDLIRYGMKNIAGQYHDIYEAHVDDLLERSHLSLGAALLAGDVLLADAHRLMRQANVSQERVDWAGDIFAQGIFEVIGGELLDSEAVILPKGNISAEVVARYKTASYSFISPLTSGAILAGAPQTDLEIVHLLAQELGIGYQLQDDLLGMFGDEAVIGKSVITDLREGKRTYLIEQFDKLASRQQYEAFYNIFHTFNLSEEDALHARHLLDESGAKKSVETTLEQKRQTALHYASKLAISPDTLRSFQSIIDTCLKRVS